MRLLPNPRRLGVTVPGGRTYTGVVDTPLDNVPEGDGNVLVANGWTKLPALAGVLDSATSVTGDGYATITASGNAAQDTATILAAFATPGAKLKPSGVFELMQTVYIADDVSIDATKATFNQNFAGNLICNTAYLTSTGVNKNISWVGGEINRRGYLGATSIELSTCLFVGVKNLTFKPASMLSTNGKFAVHLVDVDGFDVGGITFNVHADGVHMTHSCRNGKVYGLRGVTGDDTVAITVFDYANYNFPTRYGSCYNIKIDDIETATIRNAVKVLAGKHPDTAVFGNVSNIEISNVRATADATAVTITSDIGSESTKGGNIDQIWLKHIRNSGTGHTVGIGSDTVQIGRLHFEDIEGAPGLSKFPVWIAGGVTIQSLVIKNCTWNTAAGTSGVSLFGPTLYPTIDTLVIDGLKFTCATKSAGLIATTATAAVLRNLVIKNTHIYQAQWAVGNFYTNTKIVLENFTTEGSIPVGGAFNIAAGAVVGVEHAALYAAGNEFIGNAGTFTSKSPGFSGDLSKMTRANGQAMTNTNAALSCGLGPAICDGTTWKNLYSGATY